VLLCRHVDAQVHIVACCGDLDDGARAGVAMLMLGFGAVSHVACGCLAGWISGLAALAIGVSYTIGAVMQRTRVKFHIPARHDLGLAAAALRYAATSRSLTGGMF